MNDEAGKSLDEYLRGAEGWAADRQRTEQRTVRVAVIIAGVLGVIALLEAIALIVLTPLKTVEPYTLLVDRQTGYVQALKPLERETIAPDTALTRSFLAQYVIAREGFNFDSLREDYRKVALLSAGEARDRYIAQMQATNPTSPLATLPRRAIVDVEIRSLVSLNADTALVHFSTVRTDPGSERQEPQLWAAVLKYRYSRAEMSAADRLTNPLGFQVLRYNRTAEMAPSLSAPTSPQSLHAPVQGRPMQGQVIPGQALPQTPSAVRSVP